MFMTIALLCLIFLLLALLILRPSPTVVIPVSPPPHTRRHVSFVAANSPSPLPRRWSAPFHRRPPDSPRAPQPDALPSVDQFGRILLSSPASDISPKPSWSLSTPLHLSFASKRRSSTASCTSTLIHLDQADTCVPSPQSSTPATQSSLQRTRFVNPFNKRPRSRTLSPPTTFKPLDTPPSTISSPSSPVSPPERRRTLVNKFKSIFKSIPPEPSPAIPSKPILTTINTRLRRKPVARTQPYGPPWNAPMPVPDFALPQHPLQKPVQTVSLSPRISRKHSVRQCSPAEIPSMSPGQLSPRAFMNKLDEKLSLLQQQHIQDSIPSPSG